MIYALKLLFSALIACGIGMAAFRKPFRELLPEASYRLAWRIVVASTVATFLCKFPAVFFIALAGIALYGNAAIANRAVGAISLYLLMSTVVPPITLHLGGIGGINYLLEIDQYRLLALVLLVVPGLRLLSRRRSPGDGGITAIDLCLVGYQFLWIYLRWRYSNLTTLLHLSFDAFLDILLPYYVASRAIRTLADLRFVAGHFVVGLLFAACIAAAETVLQHSLYSGLQTIYGVQWNLTYELTRGGLLRVQATTQQPILLAAAMLFAMGLWIWMKGLDWRRSGFIVGFAAMMLALVATGSRGPLLACALLFLLLYAMRKLSSTTVRVLLVLMVVGAALTKAAGGEAAVESVLASLFGGSKQDMSTIDYRRQLLDTSLALIQQSPWIGVPNYASQLQELKQGEGIIDIVNSYVSILLNAGVVGLTLYLTPFLIVIHRMLKQIRRDESGQLSRGSRFAASLVAMNVALLFLIFTSSTFGILQLLLTMLVALPVAWLKMTTPERDSQTLSVVEPAGKPALSMGYKMIRPRRP